jgi:malic enzyme
MGIPVGKLALYTAGAGIHPSFTLPVCLDCGTDNSQLLDDPDYLGYPQARLRGLEYDRFIETFVEAVLDVHPKAVLQWEDFKQHNAIRLLDRYRHRLATFNDDIQGTAAVVLGGILAVLRARHEPLSDQRVVFLGAGAAGIGIARLLEAQMVSDGSEPEAARGAFMMLDSKGLVYEGRSSVDEDKRRFEVSVLDLARFGFAPSGEIGLEEVVRRVRPTILIGTCATPGAFTESAIRAMAAATEAPIVLALSNPTANCEARPSDVMEWTEGRAVVATGSPFDPVIVRGERRVIGQANNVFVFPGIGLGAIVAHAREITDRMFLVAARAMAEAVTAERIALGAMYPPLSALRYISREIAIAVAREARDSGRGRLICDEDLEGAVDTAMWTPNYP